MNTELVPAEPAQLAKAQPEATELTPARLMELAIKSGSGVEILAELRKQKEWEEGRRNKVLFDAAIAAFQVACPILERTVKGARSNYTPLDHVVVQIKPLLVEFKIGFRHTTELNGDTLLVTCHISAHGHTETTTVPMPIEEGTNRSDCQHIGNSITYGKRYSLEAALGIVTAKDDLDGQGPAPKTGLEQQAAGVAADAKRPTPAPSEPAGPVAPAPVAQNLDPQQAAKAALWKALKPVRGTERNWDAAKAWLVSKKIITAAQSPENMTAEQLNIARDKVEIELMP